MEGLKMKTLAFTERKKTKSFNLLIAIVTSVDVALVLTAMTLLTMTFVRTFSDGYKPDIEKISFLGKNDVPVALSEVDHGHAENHVYHFN
jgi:hypothetical protein